MMHLTYGTSYNAVNAKFTGYFGWGRVAFLLGQFPYLRCPSGEVSSDEVEC
jgi:hypothetical protein